jgi:hypothetical protein
MEVYGSNTAAPPSLVDSVARGHCLVDDLHAVLISLNGILTGTGSDENAPGANAPSGGLLYDASSLADRLARTLKVADNLRSTIGSRSLVQCAGVGAGPLRPSY